MTKMTKSQNGSALPLVLGVLLLAAIGFAGWSYLKEPQADASATVEEALDTGKVPSQVQATEQIPDAPAEPDTTTGTADVPAGTAPVTETDTTAVPAEAAASGTVDVAKATSIRAVGNADAPIKIIEYASLTCSHCAHFANDVYPELKTKYIDTGKVYFEFREFPLNDPALKATITARCLPEDKYESFIALLFKTQDHWAGGIDYMAALRQNAKLAGMSDATFDACQAEPKIKLFVAENMQAAQEKWKIASTPTFIINDGKETISGAVPLTEFERVFRKISGDAVGEPAKVE